MNEADRDLWMGLIERLETIAEKLERIAKASEFFQNYVEQVEQVGFK